MDKPFGPRKRRVCMFFESLVPGKGGGKGSRDAHFYMNLDDPFHTPFLHHHKVQDQGYISCIYNYAQKCIVIALQKHFRKRD